MRILIAQMNHETNTFSPMPTPLAAFRPVFGAEALAAAEGKRTPVGAFLDRARAAGHEVVCPVLAHAWPSGPVEDAAFNTICTAITDALDTSIDMVLLDLHGAMVTRSTQDGEGELIARLRAKRPDVPIGVALDLHAHLSAQMVEQVQAICGYLSYPHIDMYETGLRLWDAMEIRREIGLGIAHLPLPLIAHTLPMNSTKPGAMRDILNGAIAAAQAEGMVDVSVFGGFPASDIADAGMCLVGLGRAPMTALKPLAATLWARREEFFYDQKPLATSIAEVQAALAQPGQGPVLILDHGDNCMSGGTCDNIDVLRAALNAGISGLIAGPIHDLGAVAEAFAAGIGAEITLEIGNKIAAENFAPPAPPLRLTAKVINLGPGTYQITGPIYTGMICEMGRAALLQTDQAHILLTETAHEPWDAGIFTSLGLDPAAARALLLKSRMYCRPVFEPLSKAVVECAGGGVTGSDFSLFQFSNLRRPIWPLDRNMQWEAADAAC